MHWEQTSTGHRCTRPGHVDERGQPLEFRTGEVCHYCIANPGEPLAVLDERPERDNYLLFTAAEFRSVAKAIRIKARERLDGTALDQKLAVDLFAEARQHDAKAAELEAPVLRRDHVRAMERERRRMHAGRAN